MQSHGRGDLQLGTDAVGARDQHGIGVALGIERKQRR